MRTPAEDTPFKPLGVVKPRRRGSVDGHREGKGCRFFGRLLIFSSVLGKAHAVPHKVFQGRARNMSWHLFCFCFDLMRRLTFFTLVGLATFGALGCKSRAPDVENRPTEVSTIFGDNGSWGNGSWGNGSWGNGSWGNGSWGNGTWGNGSWGNGTWSNGSWGNGTWGNGTWGNGSWGNGTWGNGTWGNGTWGNGTWGNGSWGNGSWGNGSWGNGMEFGNLAVSTLDISNLVDTSLTGLACSSSGSDPEAAMTELTVYVAAIRCALPAACPAGDTVCMSQLNCATNGNCRVITDCDGNELYVAGRDGLGTDQNNPATVASVDACIDATLKDLNEEFRAYADNLNSYAVSCALPESQGGSCSSDPGCVEVTYQLYPSGTETKQYFGGIGLVPDWKTNADFDLNPQGQRLVSACLAARTNPQRKKVQISLRGVGIPTTATEENIYIHHEGAFWGNMFDSNPVVYSCSVNGNGPSGRICTGGQCSFVDEGHCDVACVQQDADGNYTNCGAEGSTDVINTYLPLRTSLSNGFDHRCVVRVDGTTWCWGKGSTYQLGTGSSAGSTTPQAVQGLGLGVVELTAGYRHTCARKSDGSLWCWGSNLYGRLGDGTFTLRTAPTQVASLGFDVAQVRATSDHTCAVKTSGSVWCWGRNHLGQLGAPSAHTCSTSWGTYDCSPDPLEVAGVQGAIRVEVGKHFTCAIKTDGTTWCWGRNNHGILGIGNYSSQSAPVQALLPAGTKDIALGDNHACALNKNGTVWCWGKNDVGEIGDNQVGSDGAGNVTAPIQVASLPSQAIAIDAGENHSCAILVDGSLWCWGGNERGQLGVGDTHNRLVPVAVSLPGPAIEVMVNDTQTQVLLEDGRVYASGSNNHGQLGLTTTDICLVGTEEVMCAKSPLRMTVFDNCGDDICEFSESESTCAADCAPDELFFEDFSSGLGQWNAWNVGGPGWTTDPRHETTDYPVSASAGMTGHIDNCTEYCTITSKVSFDLTSYSEATLTFLRFVDQRFDTNQDYFRLKINDGTGWKTVREWAGGQGDDNKWHEETFSLTPYLGATSLKIRFWAKMNDTTENVQVDDVRIFAK